MKPPDFLTSSFSRIYHRSRFILRLYITTQTLISISVHPIERVCTFRFDRVLMGDDVCYLALVILDGDKCSLVQLSEDDGLQVVALCG